MRNKWNEEDDFMNRRRYVTRMTTLWEDKKISYDKLISIFKNNEDVLDEFEYTQIEDWEKEKRDESEKKNRERQLKKRKREKEISETLTAVWLIFCGILLIIILVTKGR